MAPADLQKMGVPMPPPPPPILGGSPPRMAGGLPTVPPAPPMAAAPSASPLSVPVPPAPKAPQVVAPPAPRAPKTPPAAEPPVGLPISRPLPVADPPVGLPVSRPLPPRSAERPASSLWPSSPASAGTRVSRVPSVPELFDDEPKAQELDAAEIPETNYPDVLLEPLHMLDPLCLKWKLGVLSGACAASSPAPAPAAAPAPPVPAPTPAPVPVAQGTPYAAASPMAPALHPAPYVAVPPAAPAPAPVAGYLRLFALLSTGESWEYRISLTDMVQRGRVILGRDPSCSDVILSEPSISRRHVVFECIPGGIGLTDLNSTNGTMLNNTPLNAYTQCVPVQDGSLLVLGDVTLHVEIFGAHQL